MKQTFEFMGEVIDFVHKTPVAIVMRNYKAQADWPDGNVINYLGMIFRTDKGGYLGSFRLRYPSGNKSALRVSDKPRDYDAVLADMTTKIDGMMTGGKMGCEIIEAKLIELPPQAQDCDGFMAVLAASNMFDMATVPGA